MRVNRPSRVFALSTTTTVMVLSVMVLGNVVTHAEIFEYPNKHDGDYLLAKTWKGWEEQKGFNYRVFR